MQKYPQQYLQFAASYGFLQAFFFGGPSHSIPEFQTPAKNHMLEPPWSGGASATLYRTQKTQGGGTGPMGTVRGTCGKVGLEEGQRYPDQKTPWDFCVQKMVFLQENAKKNPHKRMAEHVWTSR